MSPELRNKKFGEFYKSARQNTVLEPKTTLLVHLGSAMAVGCYPCMEYYFSQADELGITEQEIEAVQSIVMAVSAGRVNMQVDEVRARCHESPSGKGECSGSV